MSEDEILDRIAETSMGYYNDAEDTYRRCEREMEVCPFIECNGGDWACRIPQGQDAPCEDMDD